MKKLFIVSTASGYGGAERSIELIVRQLPADVRAWVFAQNAVHIEQLRQPGGLPDHATLVPIHRTASLSGKRMAALRLAFEYARQRPDAVLLNTHTAALLAAMAAKFLPGLGQRCHLYVRDFLWNDLPYILGRLPGAGILVPSEVVADRCGYLAPDYLRPYGAHPWTVVPDMVELPAQAATDGDVFLHLATINPWKGHSDLIVASHLLARRGTPVPVLSIGINGHPPLRERLRRLIETFDLGERFTLSDYEPDPSTRLRACRAVVVPSVSHSGGPETFCRAIIEAWAHGKPVIAYAAGAPARLVRDGVDGLLVHEGDTQGLADAMHRLHADPGLARRLGQAGHGRARAQYQAPDVTRRLLARLFDAHTEALHAALPDRP